MTRSETLFSDAQKVIPGGVNSPVRAFKSVGGCPVYIDHAEGPYIYDADGRRYIDYIGSWGPMILGHAHPEVIETVHAAVNRGLSFGAPTAIETELAELVCDLVPAVEQVRMVSSGTEAAMTAIRLARGITGRDKIVKFEGCYHGHADSVLVKAGSGALTLGIPNSPGVPEELARLTITIDYNDSDQVRELFSKMGSEIACVMIEPVAGNMNCIPPLPGFLETLREQCTEHGALLIFDEVMTCFRVHRSCAQTLFGVTPDVTAFGKVIGGGMPVGAIGGPREHMEQLAPTGSIYQAGTLSGNPVAMAAGLATLKLVSQPGFHERLETHTERLVTGIAAAAAAAGIPLSTNHVCGMFGLFFTADGPVTNFTQTTACDVARFKRFFHGMLEQGVYLAPSAFEAGFISAAHDEAVVDETIAAAARVFAEIG